MKLKVHNINRSILIQEYNVDNLLYSAFAVYTELAAIFIACPKSIFVNFDSNSSIPIIKSYITPIG